MAACIFWLLQNVSRLWAAPIDTGMMQPSDIDDIARGMLDVSVAVSPFRKQLQACFSGSVLGSLGALAGEAHEQLRPRAATWTLA